VEVVSEAEYEDYLAGLQAQGQTGDINEAYHRLTNAPGTGATTEEEE
jgi:cytochrome c oxidase subunit 2